MVRCYLIIDNKRTSAVLIKKKDLQGHLTTLSYATVVYTAKNHPDFSEIRLAAKNNKFLVIDSPIMSHRTIEHLCAPPSHSSLGAPLHYWVMFSLMTAQSSCQPTKSSCVMTAFPDYNMPTF